MMIGVFFKRRRREFLEFVSHNPIDYQEILDPTDTDSLKQYTAIFSDGSELCSEPFDVIDVSSADLSEVFAPYIKKHKLKEIYTDERFYSAVFYYYEKMQGGCSQIYIPPIVDVDTAYKEVETSLPIRNFNIIQQNNDIDLTSVVEDIDDKPLVTTQLDSSTELEPLIESEIADIAQTNVFVEHQSTSPSQPQSLNNSINLFGSQSAQHVDDFNLITTQTQVSVRNQPVRMTGSMQVRRKGTGAHKRRGAPVYTFSSLTDKAGTTTVSFLLAKALASQNFDTKILYLDLNISNPNSISNLLGVCGDSDASIVNIASAGNIDFAANLSLLTDTVAAGDGAFSMITFGEATFRQKTGFSTINYTQFLYTLADSFDIVFVDLGKLQGTMPYQQMVLQSPNAKHILVADGSSVRTVNAFISAAQGLNGFEIIVNKSSPSVGTFMFDRAMHITPLGAVRYHNNTARYITDVMQFEGTDLKSELETLGGML